MVLIRNAALTALIIVISTVFVLSGCSRPAAPAAAVPVSPTAAPAAQVASAPTPVPSATATAAPTPAAPTPLPATPVQATPAPTAITPAVPEPQPLAEPMEKSDFLLDTMCSVKVYDNVPKSVLDKAFSKISEIDKSMSAQNGASEVSAINNAAGKNAVRVSDNTYYVIKRGVHWGELTGGIFDIAIGPIVRLWGIGTDHAGVPAQQDITDRLPLVNYKNIILKDSDKSVMLKKSGMSIDLGGIAKGYTADAVAQVLKENGVRHAIINLGGNVLVIGGKTDGSNWRIGIQDPFEAHGAYIGIVEVSDKTVVTSGIYERYFKQNGKIYHHMLNPKDGYPFDNSLAGVSIITDKSVDADGLSTSAFGLGLEDGLKFVEGLKGFDAIFITRNSEVYITKGLKGKFKLTNPDFVLKN